MINCSNLLRKSYGLKNSTIFGYEYTFNRKICCCYFCNFCLLRDPFKGPSLTFSIKFHYICYFCNFIYNCNLLDGPFSFLIYYSFYSCNFIFAIKFFTSEKNFPSCVFFSVFYEFCFIFAIFFLLKLWRKFDGQRAW